MAYATLVSLEQTINQILNHNQYSTSPHEKQLLESVYENVISFQSFLEEFAEKARNLEGRMMDEATAAEDIIESFMLKQIRRKWIKWIDVAARIKFVYELRKAVQKMNSVATEMVEIKNSIVIEDHQLNDSSHNSSSSGATPAEKFVMVGFDDDLLEIKCRLVAESPQLQFLSIVGMGGIGKTTLAKNAYDDQSIQERFDIRAWVTVSQNYRVLEIFSCLLDSMKEFDHPEGFRCMENRVVENECSEMKISEKICRMKERVYKILKGRKYIIVMDDVWSTEVLDDARSFPDDGNGSRIMLTTRLSHVADYAYSSIPPYEMSGMDENQSWNLFQQKVSEHQNSGIPPELVTIGKGITRSCRGLPLAVVVVAGMLSNITRTPASWGEIARNITSAASKDERLEKILSLSYNNLPHRLRACLLYMGAFPEDHMIRVSDLVKLWTAEGFLKHPKEPSKTQEEGAEESLEELVRRNLVLVTERKFNGRIKSCSIHDMVRDACRKLLQEVNNLRLVTDKFMKNTKHPGCISMRSLLFFDCFIGSCDHLRLLRVLHEPHVVYIFRGRPIRNIVKLYHLRYLSFRCYIIPSAISNFQNLQTLVINNGGMGEELPSSIWKMWQLRHLIFTGRLPDPERPTSALPNLQTLKEVHDQEHRAILLKRTPNLRKLGIHCGNEFFDRGQHLNESLAYLCKLEKLKINLKYPLSESLDVVFPSSLRECTLEGWKLPARFLKSIGSLPNLEVLKLKNCSLDPGLWAMSGGEFPELKFLLISRVKFQALVTQEEDMPRLKCLHLHSCYQLVKLSDDIGEISTLELIEVKDCMKDVYEWARRVEEEQRSYGNESLQVCCIGR